MGYLQPAKYLLVIAPVMPESLIFFFFSSREGEIDPGQKVLRTISCLWQTPSVCSTSEVIFLFYV